MIKRIISILIAVTMLFSLTAYAKNYSVDILGGMQLLSQGMPESGNVTRAQFASVASAVAGLGNGEVTSTQYSDVTSDNIYSGAIRLVSEAGYMSGVGGDTFAPDGLVTGEQALTVFVRILGYESAAIANGGWPNGYMSLAQKLGLFKAFSAPVTEPLTFNVLWELCDLVLEAPAANTGYVSVDGQIVENLYVSGDNASYMNKALDVYRYEGMVSSIDDAKHACVVTVTESDDDAPYSEGDSISLAVSTSINILEYDKAPVEIYATGSGKLLSMDFAEGSEYKYAVISSVNGDVRETVKYNPSAISEIMFLDDSRKYKIYDEGLTVYLNGSKLSGSLKLTGRYARVILNDNKVMSLELWDLTEGGLITEADYNQIVFAKGELTERISDIESIERRMVVINGEYRDISELKPNTVFDYYKAKNNDELIIFASEKKISDTYSSYSEDSVEIGNLYLIPAENIYASMDGSKYEADKIDELLNCGVTAYVDVCEKVRYIRLESGELSDNEFMGYLMGYKQGGLSQDEIALVNLESDSFEKKVYTLSKKLVYKDGLDSSTVYASASSEDGSAIYSFKTNGSDEVISISKVNAFHGFADANGDAMVKGDSIGSFPQSAFPFMWVGGKKLYFDFDTYIVGMYESNGELTFKKCLWRELEGKNCSDEDVVVRFFGEEMSSEVELIFMSGPLDSITPYENTYGIITRISDALDAEGEPAKKVVINDEYGYVLSAEDASGLENNMFVCYSRGTLFGENDISVISSLALKGDMFDWVGVANSDYMVYTATVEKADKKRLYFTNGTSHFINQSQPLYFRVSEDGKLSTGSYMDGLSGRDIVYIADNSLVYAVFYKY